MAEYVHTYPSVKAVAAFDNGRHWAAKLKAWNRTARDRKVWAGRQQQVDLRCTRPVEPLAKGEIALIALCRDNVDMIDAFLDHYRRLGVDRFLLVDDQSTDGTREHLEVQGDVDLHISNVRYADAARGRYWRETLLERYGRDRWYVNVDVDEFLVFPETYGSSLRSLIEALEAVGEKHLWAPMLDMLPAVDDQAAQPPNAPRTTFPKLDDLIAACPHFDGAGYSWTQKARQQYVVGGARQRIFGQTLELTKYPLIYADRHTNFGLSIHTPMPYWRNIVAPKGALLHFKYMPGIIERTRAAVQDGQYFNGAESYREALERLEEAPVNWLGDGTALRFTSVEQLVDLGFIAPGRTA